MLRMLHDDEIARHIRAFLPKHKGAERRVGTR
jgi:hypothetical protein